MLIEYLNMLQNNPSLEINRSGQYSTISGISEAEIQQLEQQYNNGTPFPKALRELLFLAGNSCYVLEYGYKETNNIQQELQEEALESIILYNRTFNRPFYVIESYDGAEIITLAFLDEGDNPMVYTVYLPELKYDNATAWCTSIGKNLKDFINTRIDKVKQGFTPF